MLQLIVDYQPLHKSDIEHVTRRSTDKPTRASNTNATHNTPRSQVTHRSHWKPDSQALRKRGKAFHEKDRERGKKLDGNTATPLPPLRSLLAFLDVESSPLDRTPTNTARRVSANSFKSKGAQKRAFYGRIYGPIRFLTERVSGFPVSARIISPTWLAGGCKQARGYELRAAEDRERIPWREAGPRVPGVCEGTAGVFCLVLFVHKPKSSDPSEEEEKFVSGATPRMVSSPARRRAHLAPAFDTSATCGTGSAEPGERRRLVLDGGDESVSYPTRHRLQIRGSSLEESLLTEGRKEVNTTFSLTPPESGLAPLGLAGSDLLRLTLNCRARPSAADAVRMQCGCEEGIWSGYGTCPGTGSESKESSLDAALQVSGMVQARDQKMIGGWESAMGGGGMLAGGLPTYSEEVIPENGFLEICLGPLQIRPNFTHAATKARTKARTEGGNLTSTTV
ncbi:unnamed protein product [Diplocarpon coronariae]